MLRQHGASAAAGGDDVRSSTTVFDDTASAAGRCLIAVVNLPRCACEGRHKLEPHRSSIYAVGSSSSIVLFYAADDRPPTRVIPSQLDIVDTFVVGRRHDVYRQSGWPLCAGDLLISSHKCIRLPKPIATDSWQYE